MSEREISDAEREVLKALWTLGLSPVRAIREQLESQGREWAHTTVGTLLSRLEEKQFVQRDTSGFAHQFEAVVSRNDLMQRRLGDLADNYCDGSTVPLMLALVDQQRLSTEQVDRLRQMLDELEASADSRPQSGKTRKSKAGRKKKSR